MVTVVALKILGKAGIFLSADKTLPFHHIIYYTLATLPEQGYKFSEKYRSNGVAFPIRVFMSFWLLFALVFTTAYKAKLTTLMGFPFRNSVPETFQQLADSDFGVGLNGIKKGTIKSLHILSLKVFILNALIFADERTYLFLSTGKVKKYKDTLAKVQLYPNATSCILQALHERFACITSEDIAARTFAKSVGRTDGRYSLKISRSAANLMEWGVVSTFS